MGDVVAEYDGTGQVVAHYTYGLGLTSRVARDGTSAFYGFDALGNTAQLTGPGGTVLNRYSYLPFGESLSSTASVPNPFTYVGQLGVMDSGQGLYLMRARWYSPGLGRFLSEDQAGL